MIGLECEEIVHFGVRLNGEARLRWSGLGCLEVGEKMISYRMIISRGQSIIY
jgi:hypothetical protein